MCTQINSKLLTLLLVFSFLSCGQAQTPIKHSAQIKNQIDQLFLGWNGIETPGASVSVMYDGKVLFSKGYGAAHLEYDIPITPNTIFHVASVSKQFTAFSILLLAEDGMLSIDDEVRKYIPEVPDFGKRITLRHLMTHTSGMRDQWNLLAMAGWRLDDVITKEHVLALVERQKELNFDPGEEYAYCNTGFTLLAEIVSRVSNLTFAEFTEKHIFEPLDMTNTLFYDDHEKIVQNRAYSYSRSGDGFQKSVLSYANVGATSLFTTAEDIQKWADNMHHPKVGNDKIIQLMNTEATLNDGSKFGGAMGQFVNEHNGLKQIQHGGADAGYRSYLGRFPDQKFSVAVLSNLGDFNPTRKALEVADLYLSQFYQKEDLVAKKEEENKVYNSIEMNSEKLSKFEGTYWNDAGSYTRYIFVENDTLRYGRGGQNESPLIPINDSQFQMLNVDVDLVVSFDQKDGVDQMIVTINDGAPIISEAFEAPNYDEADLRSFVGNYFSEELGANYILKLENGSLVLNHLRNGKISLEVLKRDIFRSNRWYFGVVQFVRNSDGKITGMKVSNGRVRNLWFERI